MQIFLEISLCMRVYVSIPLLCRFLLNMTYKELSIFFFFFHSVFFVIINFSYLTTVHVENYPHCLLDQVLLDKTLTIFRKWSIFVIMSIVNEFIFFFIVFSTVLYKWHSCNSHFILSGGFG